MARYLSLLCLRSVLAIWLLIISRLRENLTEEMEWCRVIETEESFVRIASNKYKVRLWPSPRIPYSLHSSLRNSDKISFNLALANYHRHTCLRFEPRKPYETAYIDISINFDNWYICGAAHLCYQGHRQEVEIAHDCTDVDTFIHEIGHALCLHHEQKRVDRDEYLDMSTCDNPSEILPIVDCLTTRGNLFDYHSQMLYNCGKCVGFPRMEGVAKCGPSENNRGLSVLDADKLNAYYNCQGCHRHRWYRVDTLTSDEKSSLVNFGSSRGGQQAYLCRGYVKGEIATGTYIESERSCEVPFDRDSYKVTKDIQLFALPNGSRVINTRTSSGYRLFHPLDYSQSHNFVRMGRMADNTNVYGAVREIRRSNGRKVTLLGKVLAFSLHWGLFPRWGREEIVPLVNHDAPEYYIIGCSE